MSCPRRRSVRRLLRLLMFASLALAPGLAWAQAASPASPPDASDRTQPATTRAADAAQPARFFETVTVSSTLNPVAVKDTPGTVSVIDAETIERRLIENVADLVKFEPGVYIDTTVNRIGLNGFNIRGIGGNRVMTQVDGVETSEQFDFGPFNVHQFALDLDALKTAEIVRSAGSSLYGSDALGGVVSFFTRDPSDYLAGRPLHVAGKTLFDGRARDTSGNVVLAGGGPRVQASIFASYSAGGEPGNKGTVETEGPTRTALNPQDRHGVQALGKFTIAGTRGSLFRTAVEIADTRVETRRSRRAA
jgi:hemoglobin/transferrin/lactoferrin receptor protein